MTEVQVRNPEDPTSFDRAMKTFKKLVEKSEIIKQCNDRRYYSKPSEKRRAKQRERERQTYLEQKEKE
jgi:ribosomal protein S21